MVEHGELRARDGRRVTYGWFGAEDGTTVVHCHGGAESSAFEVDPDWTASMGVRVVTPNRPGFSTSDPVDERDVASWTDDLVDLAAHLGVDRLGVLGWSAGGSHALAAGARCGDLVEAVTVVSAPGPVDLAPQLKEHLSPTMQMLADYTTAGIAHDSVALYRPWGFDLAGVSAPTSIWHGTDDGVAHVDNGRWLAGAVPGAQLHEIDRGGHFVAMSHWRQILEDHLALRG